MNRVLVLPLSLSMQLGCITDLSGAWDGEVDCGANGSVDILAEIDSRDSYFEGTYEGTALVDGLTMNEVETEIEMNLSFSQPTARGPQVLRVDAACALRQGDEPPVLMDCDGFSELGWDGKDTLSGIVVNFLELFDCEIEMRR
jgi:hypothetical protein